MADNRIKITVQLIDAATDNHLWSETYEREFKDIFAIQTDIATAVARELRTKLNSETKGELASIPTKSKLAYEFYLKGRDYESKYENPNAILMYSRAIQEDSMFALAYARRAHAHLLRFWVKKLGWEGHKELARNDIDVVMKIDPDLPELKLALAFWHYYGFRDYEKALTLLKELQITTPNDPDLHRILFALYRRQGRWKESILESEKALSLDPLNTSIINEFCSTYKLLHQYNDQLTTAKRGHFLIPEFKGFKWQILSAEINLRYNVATAIKASGLTVEESRGFRDYYNKNYSDVMATIRKEGIRVISGEYDFKPITLTYAAIYFLKGDRLMTKVYADSAISFLLKKLPDMDNDDRIYSSLGIAYAIAGQEKLAIEYGKKAIDLLPVSLDVWNGTFPEEKMANIYVYLAKYDLALKKMEPLLSKPSEFGIGWLLTDPLYEPLHNLPRFKELVEKYR